MDVKFTRVKFSSVFFFFEPVIEAITLYDIKRRTEVVFGDSTRLPLDV